MDYFAGKRVLITGHTGFKGSWMALWLQRLGAEVHCYSLPENILDPINLGWAFDQAKPHTVFHFAAQAILRNGYRYPTSTWETNVLGTLNVLEACRRHGSPAVVATSDKVYDAFWTEPYTHPFRESDRLGGHDPYSSSKAAVEVAVDSWRRAYGLVASTVRCGNVIGGNDWGEHRLVPNLVRAIQERKPAPLYTRYGVRPWVHVLDACAGYLAVARAQLQDPNKLAGAYNIGGAECCTAEELVQSLIRHWGSGSYELVSPPSAGREIETDVLRLDCSKSRDLLGWRPKLTLDQAVARTVQWYRELANQHGCLQQIAEF